jgi:hypothetical protein
VNRLLLAVLPLLVVACGVPGDGDVQVLDRNAVPFGLLQQAEGVATATPEGAALVEVFLVAGDAPVLIPAERRVERPTLPAVLAALAAGPTAPEAVLGLRSPLGDGDFVAASALEGGIATVDLTEDFATLSGDDQLLAIGQIVLSLTARPGVGRVAFTLAGDRVEIPRGDGSLTSGSVSRDAYLPLLGAGTAGPLAEGPRAAPAGSVAGMVTGRR